MAAWEIIGRGMFQPRRTLDLFEVPQPSFHVQFPPPSRIEASRVSKRILIQTGVRPFGLKSAGAVEPRIPGASGTPPLLGPLRYVSCSQPEGAKR